MLSAFLKAIEQIPDPRFLKTLFVGILCAVATLILVWSTVGWALGQVDWTQLWLIGGLIEGLGDYADEVGWLSFSIGAMGLTWLLFPAAAVAAISLFLEPICIAVEQKHYPHRPPPRQESFLETLLNAVWFLGVTFLINLIALPVYLLLLFFFGSGAFLFIIINGYLVSREFFELIAARRMGPRNVRSMRKTCRGTLWLFGGLTVFLMSIPVVNLIVPAIAAAAMLHLYEGLARKDEFEARE